MEDLVEFEWGLVDRNLVRDLTEQALMERCWYEEGRRYDGRNPNEMLDLMVDLAETVVARYQATRVERLEAMVRESQAAVRTAQRAVETAARGRAMVERFDWEEPRPEVAWVRRVLQTYAGCRNAGFCQAYARYVVEGRWIPLAVLREIWETVLPGVACEALVEEVAG